MIPLKSSTLSGDQRRLVELFKTLATADRAALLAFAEFLAQRAADAVPAGGEGSDRLPEPEPIPRPAKESVVGAIRRLSATYHMIDRGALLHAASNLMGAHVLHGRPAPEVIDELEALFRGAYEDLTGNGREG